MLEQIWNGILGLTAQLVIPDWGQLVALALPVGTTVVVALGLIWTFRRVLRTPPAQRGKRRIGPATPSGIHMPGPSLAPFFGAVGVE